MRGRRVKINEDGDGEVDVNFWAQAAADQANGRREDDDGDEGFYYISPLHMPSKAYTHNLGGSGNVPFNTQFFQDDYDDGGGFGPSFDDDGDGPPQGVDGDEDLLTQNPKKRIRPETFNYAKRAKRVDVRKLKDNIWKGLDIVVPHKKDIADEERDEDEMVSLNLFLHTLMGTDTVKKGCRIGYPTYGSIGSAPIQPGDHRTSKDVPERQNG